jgi:hypothetical protein
LLFSAVLTDGFGLVMPDDASAPIRWISALAMSLLLAIPAAGIAVAMWRVAYRPA